MKPPPEPLATVPGAGRLAPGATDRGPVDLDAPLDEALALLGPCRRLTVLVNDPQRHTASRAVLERLARRVQPESIRLVVATGSHHADAATRTAFERALGRPAAGAVEWHDCRADDLLPVGPDGAWRGHPALLAGDAVLAIGSVEPHYFAGYTGAHKTATIGVASFADIEANHAAAMDLACRPGLLAGNPVAEGVFSMLAALEGVRPVAAVHLVQAGPQVLAAAGGATRAALDEAVGWAREAFVRTVEPAADALVAEVTGPLAESFYQADKGIKNTEWAVRDGGCLVLWAGCPRGIGQDAFCELLRQAPTYAAAVETVARRGYRLGDHKAVRLRYLTDPATRGVRAFIVSPGLSDADANLLGLAKAPTVAAALHAAGVRAETDAIVHVRDAGNLAVTTNPSAGSGG